MKKFFRIIIPFVIVLIAILLFRTSSFKSKQLVSENGKRKEVAVDDSAIARLREAIRINTVSYDDTAIVNQAPFDCFFAFLKTAYPEVFAQVEDTIINQKSLLLKWTGRKERVKPVIFYAHLDVVPTEENTKAQWKHEPFSGDVAEGYVWGRGTLDDKGSLVALFEAINRLIKKGITPERTIYFAFGSDEEIGGKQGAQAIADYLKAKQVKFEFYIDEGGMVSEGIVPNIKRPVAIIGTAEKGYITLELTVNLKGGHSSRPPKESALDVLVAAVKKLHENPQERRTTEPVEEFLEYVGPEMGMPLKVVFANRWLFEPMILNEYEKSDDGRALLRTTSIATVMNAGVKENVIPSKVSAKVNYRILNDETSEAVKKRTADVINDDRVIISDQERYEPSKTSSSSTYGFGLIQQTAANVFPDAIVAPFLMLGSTDSKHFQDITENTYRFLPVRMNEEQLGAVHGINEKVGVKDFMESIAFYESMMRNLK